jgi:hypothetical protein
MNIWFNYQVKIISKYKKDFSSFLTDSDLLYLVDCI